MAVCELETEVIFYNSLNRNFQWLFFEVAAFQLSPAFLFFRKVENTIANSPNFKIGYLLRLFSYG